ncbi:Sec34-domain-containing protein [Hesseltinella vesiculosa]|uniref:Conserved oligomeric Golgi complex subunit 3 n=1 Tax=Hesseltinella vesiculosa TaxID=101127 RepID=A0A1X2GQJ9_9FUNG|nr:Sec34-domain-containing protein [Hesseltinella vesiculosa]
MATKRATRTISLEEWEEKTQLSEKQLASVQDIKDACLDLPLPSSWYFNDKSFASPALISSGGRTPDASSLHLMTPVNAGTLSSQLRAIKRNRSASNLLNDSQVAALERQLSLDIGTDKPIETLQQFYDWFAVKEKEMEQGQEDVYRHYMSNVQFYQSACVDLLSDLEATNTLFQDLLQDYGFVENQTKSLQSICEQLLHEQEHYTHLADALTERLAYFNQLEPITKSLNAPGDNICLQPDFIPMLEKLDECIQYMNDHLNYHDAELYLMRFRQCLTRGMTLIKMYAITAIKNVGYESYKQIMSQASDPTITLSKQTTLFLVKFKGMAAKIKTLTDQLEKRGRDHKEYHDLYKEIVHVYIQTRQQVLSPIITRRVIELGATGNDLLAFARQGSAYIMSLCTDEYNLFYSFFHSGEAELDGHLELLTSYLHDYIRPRIIHETSIPVLSELCTIFDLYVQEDFQAGVARQSDRREPDFGHLIQNVLEDAQSRLVFRAQRYIQTDIHSYQNQPDDLLQKSPFAQEPMDNNPSPSQHALSSSGNGPATLTIEEDAAAETPMPQDTTVSNALPSSTSPTSSVPNASPTLSDPSWYPTLQKTLWLLSKLYRCVQTPVFEDLAQEAITVCTTSLKMASETLKVKVRRTSRKIEQAQTGSFF